jgi:acyl transferase domain-containing protein
LRRKLALPTYPFQRRRHWLDADENQPPKPPPATAASMAAAGSLLGRRLHSPALSATVFETELSAAALPALRDHRLYGEPVVSGVLHLSLVSAAMQELATPLRGLVFQGIQFLQPLILPETGTRTVQTLLSADPSGSTSFQLLSFAESDPGAGAAPRFVVHSCGQVRPLSAEDGGGPMDAAGRIAALKQRCVEERDGADFYARLWRLDEHYLGPSYRTIERIFRRDGEALVLLQLPADEVLRPPGSSDPIALPFLRLVSIGEVYGQALMPALPDYERIALHPDSTFVGQGLDRSWELLGQAHRARYCHALLRGLSDDELCGDVWLLDAEGQVLGAAEGLRVRRVDRALVRQAVAGLRRRRRAVVFGRGELQALPADEQRQRLAQYLAERLAEVLGIATETVTTDDTLLSLGMDSLMAVELASCLRAELLVELPTSELVPGNGLTLGRLTEMLLAEISAS